METLNCRLEMRKSTILQLQDLRIDYRTRTVIFNLRGLDPKASRAGILWGSRKGNELNLKNYHLHQIGW